MKRRNNINSLARHSYGLGLGMLMVFSSLLLVSYIATSPVAADTASSRPDGDGTIGTGWSKTGGTTYFSQINTVVTQPTNPGTATNINIGSKTDDTAFFSMQDIAAAKTTTSITVWIYHNDSSTSNNGIKAQLYDSNESTTFSTEQQYPARNGAQWDSLTFSGLSLTNSQLSNMRVKLTGTRSGGPNTTQFIYNLYASVTYTAYAPAPVADVVNGSNVSVGSPSYAFGSATTLFTCQTKTATLGTATQLLKITNDTNNTNWTLTMAPSGGTAASWLNEFANKYDFNDPTSSGCSDGPDADLLAGQLSVNPSVGTLAAQSGCTTTGVSKGSSSAFNEGTINNITLLTGTAAQLDCYWTLINVSMSQSIPARAPPGTYNLNFVLTAASV